MGMSFRNGPLSCTTAREPPSQRDDDSALDCNASGHSLGDLLKRMKPHARNRIYWTMVSAIPSYRSVASVAAASPCGSPRRTDSQNVAVGLATGRCAGIEFLVRHPRELPSLSSRDTRPSRTLTGGA